jgi:endonuclease/exonuclease/phosphatase family metal-dependent hydrolase
MNLFRLQSQDLLKKQGACLLPRDYCGKVGWMRIVFLNTWHGKVEEALTSYLQQKAPTTDIFCFQEADADMQRLCTQVLPEYNVYADRKFITDTDDFSQTTYVRKDIVVTSSGSILKDHPRTGLGLYVEIKTGEERLFICNFHGMSRPVDKLDNQDRVLQSTALLEFFKDKKQVVIGGDFNVLPETNSIRMFHEWGYQDLINKYGITNTRNRYVWERYPDTKQYYSDYAFVSPEVHCLKFSVPNNEVSDHLPLELEIAA